MTETTDQTMLTETRFPGTSERNVRRPLVFVVEDDPDIGQLICYHLNQRGYLTTWFNSAEQVIADAQKLRPELFLLDVMLPGQDGFDLCRQIRQVGCLATSRIIFLTARTNEADRVAGLTMGADGYITKPFVPRELLARVRTVLRHQPEREPVQVAKFGRIEIDSLAMTVKVRGEAIPTTVREFRLLEYLARHAARVFTRNQLLDTVWAENSFVTPRSIDVYIRRLREKIEADPENPLYLIAVRGVGYRFEVPREHAVAHSVATLQASN